MKENEMTDFKSFGLSETLLKSLDNMGFTTPTPIQEAAIPLALNGRDVLGSAQTGTGKTGAFSIPMIEMLMRDQTKTALVLTPTRELAKQVLEAIRNMIGNQKNIKTAFIIGGEPYNKQFAQLKNRPRVIVGTPGRVNDHLDRKTMDLSNVGCLVLDETDRMLDMGFGAQLDRINTHLPKERQTFLFSATIPQEIAQIAKKYLRNPERVSVGATNVVAPKIKQEVMRIRHELKHDELVRQLNTREGTVIIFVKTKYGTEKMAKRLRGDGFTADALHGDLRQRKRDKVMQEFRNKKFRILCATDIAARGLDVPHIEHVINHDLPQVAEDYIHRMGRTARAGADGSALSFISPADNRMWSDIEKLLGIKSNDNGGQKRSYNKSEGKGSKPFAKKGRWKKTGGPDGRSFEGKKRDDRNSSGEGKKPWDKKKSSSTEGKKTWGDKPRFDKSSSGEGKKPWDKKKSSSTEGKKTWGDKKPSAGGFKKKFGGKPNSNGGKPSGGRPNFKNRDKAA